MLLERSRRLGLTPTEGPAIQPPSVRLLDAMCLVALEVSVVCDPRVLR